MTHYLFQFFLLLHIVGFILFIGVTAVDFIIMRQFWQQYEYDPLQARTTWQVVTKLPPLMGIGIGLIIITAVGMMYLTNGVYGEQLWLRIKFPIVVITIVNGLLVRRKAGSRLSAVFQQKESSVEMGKSKRNLRAFHVSQLIMFCIILLLSVFKFN